jgi:hypothetical protein
MPTKYFSEEIYDLISHCLIIDHDNISDARRIDEEQWEYPIVINELLKSDFKPYQTLAVELAKQLHIFHSVFAKIDHFRYYKFDYPSEIMDHIEKNIDEKTILSLIASVKDRVQKDENDGIWVDGVMDFFNEFRPPWALGHLLKLLEQPEVDNYIRSKLIRIIGNYKDETAIDPLIRQLKRNESLTKDIVWALGQIGSRKATPILQKLSKSKDEKVRCNVIEAFGEIKDPSSIDRLIEMFKEEEYLTYPQIKEILTSLIKFGDTRILGMFLDKFIKTLYLKDY